MTKLVYSVLLGLRLALPAAEDGSQPAPGPAQAPGKTADTRPARVTTTGGGFTDADVASLYPDLMGELATPGDVRLVLERLVADNAERLACILQASLDAEGNPSKKLEAGGFIGGASSTIMVHDGTDHLIAGLQRPRRIPHVHVWHPPEGAVAWVHTHHPRYGVRPSQSDLAAAAQMQHNQRANLPFIVITSISVTAYWHGHTLNSITVAGVGWWDGRNRERCARVYAQPR